TGNVYGSEEAYWAQTPFRDLTNVNNAEADPKEHKRERDRVRAAYRCAMITDEQRNEINKKHRESYH
ncbi:unnamed protein product, partial [Urochloa humidicola]